MRSVRFRNVPAFVHAHDLEAGGRTVDLAFGGAFYASLEERVHPQELPRLIELGRELKSAIEAEHDVVHPLEPELRDVYGVIFWQEEGEGPPLTQRNVTVFADGEVDRSPVRQRDVRTPCPARPLGAASARRRAPSPEHRRLRVSRPRRRRSRGRRPDRRDHRGRGQRVPHRRARVHARRRRPAWGRLSPSLANPEPAQGYRLPLARVLRLVSLSRLRHSRRGTRPPR